MPLAVADALPRLFQVCVNGATHVDYSRTVLLAERYRRMATGVDLASEMRQMAGRESDAEYTSRLRMTTFTVSASWNEGRTPFYETARLRGGTVDKRLDYAATVPVTEAQRRQQRLGTAIEHYYNRRPIESYLAERLAKSHMMSDPNAWLLTEFDPFDFRTQVAQPYPLLIPCEAAVDFGRQAGVTSYFTARFAIPAYPGAWRYCCYLENQAIDCWPVVYEGDVPTSTIPGGPVAGQAFREITPTGEPGKVVYEYRILTTKAGRVPAKVLGYVVDEEGTGETFVSPLHAGLPFLLQMLKVGSENDIVMSQMAIPIRSTYARSCQGSIHGDGEVHACVNGMDPRTLSPCSSCGGSGTLPVPITALQTLTLPFPKPDEELKVKPADMLAFIGPSTDNPKLQLEYLESRRKLFMQAILGRPDAERVTGSKTATERQIELQAELTALAPFADQFAALQVDATMTSAGYTDTAEGLTAVYEYPPDLERVSEEDLYLLRKAAVESEADASSLEAIDARIAIKQFANDAAALTKNQVKRRFMTFLGQTNDWVTQQATLGYISAEHRVLRTHADIIFGELEVEVTNFYQLAYVAQLEKVNAKVSEILAKLPPLSAALPRMDLSPTTQPIGAVA